jgi:hypothetical protein
MPFPSTLLRNELNKGNKWVLFYELTPNSDTVHMGFCPTPEDLVHNVIKQGRLGINPKSIQLAQIVIEDGEPILADVTFIDLDNAIKARNDMD